MQEHDHIKEDASIEELNVLIKFMVSHNKSHNEELASIATKLEKAGKTKEAEKIKAIVKELSVSNDKLAQVEKDLEG
jgi:hypothetical protein